MRNVQWVGPWPHYSHVRGKLILALPIYYLNPYLLPLLYFFWWKILLILCVIAPVCMYFLNMRDIILVGHNIIMSLS